jgi:tRNA (guanosine-2'-O-)-methyltransferase
VRELGRTELKRLHREWRRRTPGRLGLVLDGIQGPFNVGAILRTAAAYRAAHLWLAGQATGPENPKVGKTALGSERFITVHRSPDAAGAIAEARALKFRVIGLELADGAQPLYEVDLRGDWCIVVGHEDRGLSPAAFSACDAVGFLPQLGRIGSLNVGTAASIACYEWARQQWTVTPS